MAEGEHERAAMEHGETGGVFPVGQNLYTTLTCSMSSVEPEVSTEQSANGFSRFMIKSLLQSKTLSLAGYGI